MANSLDRLLDGMRIALRDDVAPHVADPYARAQVESAIELLANLAEHVEWKSPPDTPTDARAFHAAQHERFTAARRRLRA